MKLPITMQRLFTNKHKYIVKAVGWTQKEADELSARLNGEQKFVVVTKNVQVEEFEQW